MKFYLQPMDKRISGILIKVANNVDDLLNQINDDLLDLERYNIITEAQAEQQMVEPLQDLK